MALGVLPLVVVLRWGTRSPRFICACPVFNCADHDIVSSLGSCVLRGWFVIAGFLAPCAGYPYMTWVPCFGFHMVLSEQ